MNKIVKILFLLVVSNGLMLTGYADRGIGKKSKTKVGLNIANGSGSLTFNLKTGLKYKGSLLNTSSTSGSTITYNNLVTFQKGNTIYILPYKQKIIVPEIRPGFTGLKLIIKTN